MISGWWILFHFDDRMFSQPFCPTIYFCGAVTQLSNLDLYCSCRWQHARHLRAQASSWNAHSSYKNHVPASTRGLQFNLSPHQWLDPHGTKQDHEDQNTIILAFLKQSVNKMTLSFQWMQNAKIMLAIPVLPLKQSVSKLVEFTFTWLSLDGNRAHRSQMCWAIPITAISPRENLALGMSRYLTRSHMQLKYLCLFLYKKIYTVIRDIDCLCNRFDNKMPNFVIYRIPVNVLAYFVARTEVTVMPMFRAPHLYDVTSISHAWVSALSQLDVLSNELIVG